MCSLRATLDKDAHVRRQLVDGYGPATSGKMKQPLLSLDLTITIETVSGIAPVLSLALSAPPDRYAPLHFLYVGHRRSGSRRPHRSWQDVRLIPSSAIECPEVRAFRTSTIALFIGGDTCHREERQLSADCRCLATCSTAHVSIRRSTDHYPSALASYLARLQPSRAAPFLCMPMHELGPGLTQSLDDSDISRAGVDTSYGSPSCLLMALADESMSDGLCSQHRLQSARSDALQKLEL